MTAGVKRAFARLFDMVRGDGLKARVVRGTLGSAGVQAGSRALALVLGVVLARSLGPDGYGIYAYAFAIMSLLMVGAEAGVPTLLMREVAAAEGRGEWGLLRGALRRGLQFVAVVSLLIAAAGLTVLTLLSDRMEPASLYTMGLMLLALPVAALAKTVTYGLRGLHRVVTAQALEMLLRPALVIALVVMVFISRPDMRAPYTAMGAQIAAVLATLALGFALLGRAAPTPSRIATPKYRSRQWLKSALPFTLISGALVLNNQTDMIMLGWFTTADEVGVYRVAVQGAVLVIFSLQAISAVVTPQLSRLHAQGNRALLQRVVRRAVRAIIIPALLIAIVLIMEGRAILSWVFGAEFSAAYSPLVILALGQLAVAVLGLSGPLLSMSGFEGHLSKAIWVSAIANVIMNGLLIPWLGVAGAALSTASTLFGWGAYLAWISYAYLGISVSPIARGPQKSSLG